MRNSRAIGMRWWFGGLLLWISNFGPWVGAADTPASATPVFAPFAWQVEPPKGSGSARHVLLGSVHMLPSSAYPLPAGLEYAFTQTEGLVLETDPAVIQESAFQKRMLEAARDAGGLQSQVSSEIYEELRRRAELIRLPMSICDPFKAWFCAMSVELYAMQIRGFSAELGLDRHFYERAVRTNRSVRWLETPEHQLALFTGMSDALSEQMLASTVESLGEPGEDPAELVRLWQQDDRAGMAELVLKLRAGFPDCYEHLLAQRNRQWIAPLEALLLEKRSQLIVVGAAHLVGPEGLPALLEARGWKLAPLRSESNPG